MPVFVTFHGELTGEVLIKINYIFQKMFQFCQCDLFLAQLFSVDLLAFVTLPFSLFPFSFLFFFFA